MNQERKVKPKSNYNKLAKSLWEIIGKQEINIVSGMFKDLHPKAVNGDIQLCWKKKENNYKDTIPTYLNVIDDQIQCMIILKHNPKKYYIYDSLVSDEWQVFDKCSMYVFNFLNNFIKISGDIREKDVVGDMISLYHMLKDLLNRDNDDINKYQKVMIYEYFEEETHLYARNIYDSLLDLEDCKHIMLKCGDLNSMKKNLKYRMIP